MVAMNVVSVMMMIVLLVMIVRVRRGAMPVCALLGSERDSLELERKSEPSDHVVENMIVAICKAPGANLERNMAVAEMVSGARQEQ